MTAPQGSNSFRSGLLLTVCLGAVSPGLVAGQQHATEPVELRATWTVRPPHSGWCLFFLMEPAEAARDLAKGVTPRTLSEVGGLPAAASRLVQEQPEYGRWVPAQICVWRASEVALDDREFDKGDGDNPLVLLWWGIPATGPAGPETAFRLLASNSGGLSRVMETKLVSMEQIRVKIEPIPETDDQETQIELKGAVIVLGGHTRPDSTLVPAPLSWTGSSRGNNNTIWTIDVDATPDSAMGMAGALRIQGKRGLARILTRSPIRLIGSVASGGLMEVRFSR